jgi:hypothetical protein
VNRERGSVTAELAAAIPVFVLLLLAGLTGVDAMTTKLRCVDAAREGARVAARGGSGEAAARAEAPTGADVRVSVDGGTVRVRVEVTTHPLGRHLPGFPVGAVAVAAMEPGVP